MLKPRNQESGQALLLVLLSIGVVITIALSVVSRSISDITVTTKDEESLRAFSAAEAGVEQILATPVARLSTNETQTPVNVGSTGGGTSQATFQASLNSYPSNRREFVYPTELASGDTATVWLADHNSTNALDCSTGRTCYTGSTMRMCWGKTGVAAASQPALVVSVLYQDTAAGNPLKYAYAAYDPSSSRRGGNNFSGSAFSSISTNTTNGAATFGGTTFATCATLNLGAGGLGLPNAVITGRRLMAVTSMALYNPATTVFGVTNLPADLPIQGRTIESTGAAGEAIRKVQVYALYPEVPAMFQAAVFSPPGVTK